QNVPYRVLASGFSTTIDIDRAYRVAFETGTGGGAIENVVGRNVHHGDAGNGAGIGKHGGANLIVPPCVLDVGFREIDLGVGCGVYHKVRLAERECCSDRE